MFKPGDKVFDIRRLDDVFTVEEYKPKPRKIIVHDTVFYKDGRYTVNGEIQLRHATPEMKQALNIVFGGDYV